MLLGYYKSLNPVEIPLPHATKFCIFIWYMSSKSCRGMGFKIFYLAITIIGCSGPTVSGGQVGSIAVDFIKTSGYNTITDTAQGTIYNFDGRLIIKVISPLSQYMIIDSLETIVYYPNERKVLIIRRTVRSFIPLFQTFVGFFRNDNPIPVLNFRISESQRKGDSLITRWTPRDKKVKFSGNLEMIYWRDMPVSTTSYDRKGRIVAQMLYSQDTTINGRHVPLHISSRLIQGKDALIETMSFRSLALDADIPPEVRGFKVPDDINPEVVQW
jgi:hypothetical protein